MTVFFSVLYSRIECCCIYWAKIVAEVQNITEMINSAIRLLCAPWRTSLAAQSFEHQDLLQAMPFLARRLGIGSVEQHGLCPSVQEGIDPTPRARDLTNGHVPMTK